MTPTSNPNVRISAIDVLSDSWYTLRKVTFDFLDRRGQWSTQQREAYDRGNGATALLIDWERRTVLLTRQFRLPAYLNGHPDGMLIETPAGLLDNDDAATAIRREVEADYRPTDRFTTGGGLAEEGEDIEVVELTLNDAMAQVADGRIADGKTVLLLQWAELQDQSLATGASCC